MAPKSQPPSSDDPRESEERYRRLVEASPEAIAVHAAGKLVYVNPAAARLVGAATPDELIGRPVLDFVHPDSRALVLQRMRETQEQGRPSELVEEKFLRLDGSPVDVETVAIPTLYAGQAATQVLIRDVTAQKAAEAALRASRDQLNVILEEITEGISVQDAQGSLVFANDAALRLLGVRDVTALQALSAADLYSQFEVFDPQGEPLPLERMPGRRALRGEPVPEMLVQFRSRSRNTARWALLRTSVLSSSDGTGDLVLTIFRDVTEQQEREQQLRAQAVRAGALAAISESFTATSLDLAGALDMVARHLVEAVGEGCIILLRADDDPVLRLAAVSHAAPEAVALIRDVYAAAPQRTDSGTHAEVMRSGQTWLVPSIAPDQVRDARPEYQAYMERFGLRSLIIAPLRTPERALGTVTLWRSGSAPPYGPEDQTFLRELADRAALALDRTSALEAERTARQDAEQVARRIARMQAVTAALSQASTLEQVAAVITEQVSVALGGAGAMVVVPSVDGATLDTLGAWRLPGQLVEQTQRFSIDAPFPLAEAVRTGKALWPETVAERSARYPHLAESYREAQGEGWVSLPLVIEDRIAGGLSVHFAEARTFDADERAYALGLGALCAQALERAQLYAQAERAIGVRDEFLSIAAHELKTPLAGLSVRAELTLRQLAKRGTLETHQVQETLTALLQQTRRLGRLVDALLDVSRLETGKLTLERAPVDMSRLVSEAVGLAGARSTGHVFQLDVPPHVTLSADALRIEQVISNVLDNALKFSPSGSTIDVVLRRLPDGVELSIQDRPLFRGPGNAAQGHLEMPN